MSSHVEQIKDKLGVAEVIGSYLQLEKAGANFKAKCPFHNEKTASFFISPTRGSYYCFGCGAKGDIISFVQEFEGLDFVGALRVLAKRAGIELTRENPKVRSERERMYLAMEYATLFFERNLNSHVKAKEYLFGRGLSEESVREWRVGYALSDWRTLADYLKSKGFTIPEIEKVGLVKKSEKNRNDVYDRFRGRIMFPIFDGSGRVVAFSGRQFEDDGTQAKYLNSPETPLFEKSRILYGYDKAKLDIRKMGFAILVEGQMDLLLSHQIGWKNAVATSGTALTSEHLAIIKRLADKVVICYDGDSAGAGAAVRGWQLALEAGLDVAIATLPDGKDPADLAIQNPDALKKAIEEARHIVEVELDRIIKTKKDTKEKLLGVEKELLPYVASLGSMALKSHFVGEIAHKAVMKEDVVWNIIKNLESKFNKVENRQAGISVNKEKYSRKEALERGLMGIYFWQKGDKPELDVWGKICSIIGEKHAESIKKVFKEKEGEVAFEAEISYQNSGKIMDFVSEISTNLKEEMLREEFADTMRKLQDAEKVKDKDEAKKLLARCQEITEEIRKMTKDKEK